MLVRPEYERELYKIDSINTSTQIFNVTGMSEDTGSVFHVHFGLLEHSAMVFLLI